jgi:hypothetical protein
MTADVTSNRTYSVRKCDDFLLERKQGPCLGHRDDTNKERDMYGIAKSDRRWNCWFGSGHNDLCTNHWDDWWRICSSRLGIVE